MHDDKLYKNQPLIIEAKKHKYDIYPEKEFVFFHSIKNDDSGKQYYFYIFYGHEVPGIYNEWILESYNYSHVKIVKMSKEDKKEFIRKVLLFGAPKFK